MATELSPRLLAHLRQSIERRPGAPAARTIRMLLDEIDRLKTRPELEAVDTEADCPLTQRQLQILVGTANGLECPAIARELSLCAQTVVKHRQAAMRRLQVRTPAQAVAVCIIRGWLPTGLVQLPEVLPKLSAAGARNAYRERAAQLRQTPGQWGTVAVYNSGSSARQSAHRLRTGAFTAFRPAGAWESQAFTEDGVHGVRARYIGTPTTAERTAS